MKKTEHSLFKLATILAFALLKFAIIVGFLVAVWYWLKLSWLI